VGFIKPNGRGGVNAPNGRHKHDEKKQSKEMEVLQKLMQQPTKV